MKTYKSNGSISEILNYVLLHGNEVINTPLSNDEGGINFHMENPLSKSDQKIWEGGNQINIDESYDNDFLMVSSKDSNDRLFFPKCNTFAEQIIFYLKNSKFFAFKLGSCITLIGLFLMWCSFSSLDQYLHKYNIHLFINGIPNVNNLTLVYYAMQAFLKMLGFLFVFGLLCFIPMILRFSLIKQEKIDAKPYFIWNIIAFIGGTSFLYLAIILNYHGNLNILTPLETINIVFSFVFFVKLLQVILLKVKLKKNFDNISIVMNLLLPLLYIILNFSFICFISKELFPTTIPVHYRNIFDLILFGINLIFIFAVFWINSNFIGSKTTVPMFLIITFSITLVLITGKILANFNFARSIGAGAYFQKIRTKKSFWSLPVLKKNAKLLHKKWANNCQLLSTNKKTTISMKNSHSSQIICPWIIWHANNYILLATSSKSKNAYPLSHASRYLDFDIKKKIASRSLIN